MKVNTQHREYERHATRWKRCQDVYEGPDAVKAAGAEYLPRLGGQDDEQYRGYLMRAEFFGAFGRTIDGFTGVVMRRPAALTVPTTIEQVLKDMTMNGITFAGFAQAAVTEVLKKGRGGVLIDWSATNLRAYTAWYDAESIVNWRTVVEGGNELLSLVVLRESVEEASPEDPFETVTREQYRVLRLLPGSGSPARGISGPGRGGGGVEVSLWQPKTEADGKKSTKEWEMVPTTPGQPNPVLLMRRQEPLPEIPFVFFGPEDITPSVQKPPLLDLADANLSHYRTSADLEHGAHFTGLPTPVITGHKAQSNTYVIGSGVAWVLEEEGARAEMLEFTGQGLQALFDLMKAKEERMAVQGGRLLEPQKRAVDAAETHRLRFSGDESVLKRLAMAVGASLADVLKWVAWWTGSDDKTVDTIACRLNTVFENTTATPEQIKAWILAMQAGRMSGATFWYLLTRAELTEPGVSWEQEQERIHADGGGGDDDDFGA